MKNHLGKCCLVSIFWDDCNIPWIDLIILILL
jgi:hypothetical protein